uniref:Uncharacterized protein n=1 Tax=Opuntia streptacantha TaxID=393608 RepID=A0A7C9CD62_OPUST
MKMGHQGIHQRIYLGISKVGEEVQSSQPLLMEYLHHQMSIMTKIFPMAFGAILPAEKLGCMGSQGNPEETICNPNPLLRKSWIQNVQATKDYQKSAHQIYQKEIIKEAQQGPTWSSP